MGLGAVRNRRKRAVPFLTFVGENFTVKTSEYNFSGPLVLSTQQVNVVQSGLVCV